MAWIRQSTLDRLQRERDAYRQAMADVHEAMCGCDRPGDPSLCAAYPRAEFSVLREDA